MANLLYIYPLQDIQADSICTEIPEAMLCCSHRVRILTTYSPENEDYRPANKIEYLMPFKNWSMFEIPKLAMSCQNFSPDLIHFFYDHQSRFSRKLLNMLVPSFFKAAFGAKLVFQILGPIPKPSLTFSQWIHQSDMVVTSDHYRLLQASSLVESPRAQLHMAMSSNIKASFESQGLEWVSHRFPEFIYVAASVRSSSEAIHIFKMLEHQVRDQPSRGIVMSIEMMQGGLFAETELQAFLQDNQMERQALLLRSVSSEQAAQLTQMCSAFFISHLGLEPESMSLALDSILNPDQLVYCTPQQAHFIKSSVRTRIQLKECLDAKPILEEVNPVYEVGGSGQYSDEVSLDPMNSVNRAYSQLLAL